MPIIPEDRPIDVVREEVIDQLIMNYGHNKISLEAFERRLDSAMATKDHATLLALVEDLELTADKEYVDLKKRELLSEPDGQAHDYPHEAKEEEYLVHIFGGSDRTGVWNVAKEVTVINIFGGGDIDLSEAIFNHRKVTIRIYSVFGGSTIFVPETINVCVKAFCVFGGVDNRAPSLDDARAPTVIIDGYAIFSGINIKVKRTFKERFSRFAEGVKSILS